MKNLTSIIMFTKMKTMFGRLLKAKVFQKSKKKIQSTFTYPSLSQISIYDWFDVLETGNIESLNTTPEHFDKLYDDYFDGIDNKASKHYINEIFKKAKLSHKIDILVKCFETLRYIYNHGLKLQNPLELEKRVIETINILHPRAKIIGTIDNKMNIVEQLILINTNDFKKINVKQSEAKANLIQQVVSIELTLNFAINLKETSVAKFIQYYKQAEKISKSKQNGTSQR